MKFNLTDFLQLDTKELLAVNGGSPCSSSSGSPSGSSSGSPSGGSGAPSSSSTNSSDGGTKTIYVPRGPFYGEQVTVRTKGNNNSSKNGNNDNSSKTVPEAWSGGSGSSGGGSCSTSTSNNPNGQGPSTTSSNPGGNQHKDTKIHSGGGTCTKTGGHSPVNPNPTNPDDVTSGGGTCTGTGGSGEGEKPDTDGGEITNPDDTIGKTSGLFGQITDGSYADLLTMQYYKNQHTVDGELTDGFSNDKSLYSKEGCLMTSVAKVLSQLTNTKITPLDINNKFDTNQDGLLSYDEIYDGLKLYLGNEYDIEGHWYEESISKERFENAATAGDTYVLARAYGDFDDNGTLEHHWVILEGYKTDAEGRMIFSYDGTSDNDSIKNRVYIFGDPHSKNEFKIDKIETFRFTNK